MPSLKNPPSISASTESIKTAPNADNPLYSANGSRPALQPPPVYVPRPATPTETVETQVNRMRPRTLTMQYRFWRTLLFAFWLFGRLIFWQIYVRRWRPEWVDRTNSDRWRRYAREFRRFAISMGGVMIKLGQFASTRADVLPEDVIRELESLQDEVPSMNYERIRPVIESELGPIGDRFEWINHESVSSASFAQVYRARLLNGDRVVVKVQRPGIRQTVYTDLAALFIVARVAMRFRFINRRADAVGLSEEFGRVLLEEISYRTEAANASRFAMMFKDNPHVYIPNVYHEHSTDHVITMEDVTTIKVSDYAALESAGISRKAVARRLMDTYMYQIFEARFFHADPHPGNLFVYPLPVADEARYRGKGGRPFYLIFIDFGMTGSLTREITQAIINTLSAVITRDARKLVQSYKALGFILPGADEKRIEEAAKAVFDQVWGLSMAEMAKMDFDTVSNIGREFNDLLYDMPFRVPQDFVYLGRTVGILTGMCTALDPAYNPWTEIQHYMQSIIGDQAGVGADIGRGLTTPVLQALSSGPRAMYDVVERVVAPQNQEARQLLSYIASGELTVIAERTAQERRQMERIEAQGKRNTRAIIFGSVLISATMLYTSGEIGLAVAAYVASGVAFIYTLLARP